jgi:hypothetical protein
MWLMLAAGGGLWSLASLPTVSFLATSYWLRAHNNILAGLERRPLSPGTDAISWRAEILPLQWRIAVSWASGYFIFQLFTPTVFAKFGPIEAGRIGLALSVFSAIQVLGMSWVNAKNPLFATLIAVGDRVALNRHFRSAALRSFLFVLVASSGLLCAVWALQTVDSRISLRLADFPVLLCLATVTLANNLIFSAATYMRAHKVEPLLLQSVLCGGLIATAVVLGSSMGVLAMMVMYMFVAVVVALPWTALLFRRFYR